ncbi:MAG: NUDIX domain-containing protein, partial [Lachnospiraceae bacterium]|nr:NUDIX domain-containing protein [Lachnospiraceae bacterium]
DKSFGGMWENTGGAVIAGESSLQAAYRELREEIGLTPGRRELIYLGDLWHPGSIVDTYMYVADIDPDTLNLQEEEVVDARLATSADIERINSEGRMVPSVYKTFCCYRSNMCDVLGVESI